jgi:hypothetical protein
MRIEQVRNAMLDTVWEEVAVLAEMRSTARPHDAERVARQLHRAQCFHDAASSVLAKLERGHAALDIPYPR